jgi:PAS domain S-box-containing protein
MALLPLFKKKFEKTDTKTLLLHKAFDDLLEGIQIHDFNWRYIYVNHALVSYSHYSKEELLGSTIMDKYPGIEHTDFFKTLDRCMKERATAHFETEFLFPDGSKADFELSIQPVPEGLFILSIDITERKKAEQEIKRLNENLEKKVAERTAELENSISELKETEEKFLAVFRTSAAGVAITRFSDSNFVDVNDAFAQLTGFSKNELIGHNSQELNMVTNVSHRQSILKEIRENGRATNFEMTIRHKSGKELAMLASVETIYLKGIRHSLNITFDINDRKIAELELAAVNKELEAFTYSVSHDLRAPLRAINGYAEILQEDFGPHLNKEGTRILQNITYNAIKMGNLIDDLLAFSKLGRAELRKEEIDLNELMDAIQIDLNKDQEQTATIKYETLHKVHADYNLLYQVLFNLVSNGIKYSSKNANAVIIISSTEQNGEIIVSVKDNGAGFDMKYANKLFGVFQRLHAQEEFEGTGVGLAIVQRIVVKHHGKVWAEGKLNEGATFYFSLPTT